MLVLGGQKDGKFQLQYPCNKARSGFRIHLGLIVFLSAFRHSKNRKGEEDNGCKGTRSFLAGKLIKDLNLLEVT